MSTKGSSTLRLATQAGGPRDRRSGWRLHRQTDENGDSPARWVGAARNPTYGNSQLRQGGAIIPLFVIALVALIAVGGLALDVGHYFLNRTRLQNAVDAAALNGATTLNQLLPNANAQTNAINDARGAFRLNAAEANAELGSIADADVIVEFTDHSNPSEPCGGLAGDANDRFVRVCINSFVTPPWLLQVVGLFGIDVPVLDQPVSAVSGPTPVPCPTKVAPMFACVDPAQAGNPPYFGYPLHTLIRLKAAPNDGKGDFGSGNYQLLDLEGSGCSKNGVEGFLAAGWNHKLCPGDIAQVDTKPGQCVGPVDKGLNVRLNCDHKLIDYPEIACDVLTAPLPRTLDQYQNDLKTLPWNEIPPAAEGRRMLTIAFVQCSGVDNGTTRNVNVLGFGCFFMRDTVQKEKGKQVVYMELTDSCGTSGGAPGPGTLVGPYRIVLYKDYDPIAADR